jgi:hypothetical protein
MPRYVVLHHQLSEGQRLRRESQAIDEVSDSHFDWMFENNEALWTWATASYPPLEQPIPLPATKLADHRKAYLTKEGAVSGNRGSVTRVEEGEFDLVRCEADHYIFALRGPRPGYAVFQRTRSGENSSELLDPWYAFFCLTLVDAS